MSEELFRRKLEELIQQALDGGIPREAVGEMLGAAIWALRLKPQPSEGTEMRIAIDKDGNVQRLLDETEKRCLKRAAAILDQLQCPTTAANIWAKLERLDETKQVVDNH